MLSHLRHFILVAICALAMQAVAAERVTYFVPNAQGSPIAAMDEHGDVIWRESYEPYGRRQVRDQANDSRVSYTGKAEDADTGLIYMGARWYDPDVARFTGTDAQGFKENNPQSFGRYVYVNNSPYMFTDPTGEYLESAWDIFNIALGVKSARDNFSAGNVGAGALDSVGVIIDSLAAALPIVPAAAGTSMKLGRAGADAASEMPERLARVVDSRFKDGANLAGPNADDVFVTAADDIAGLTTATQVAERLTLLDRAGELRSGPFTIIEFDNPMTGLAVPFNRSNPGFVSGGRTAGDAREYTLPNQPVSGLSGVTKRDVQ